MLYYKIYILIQRLYHNVVDQVLSFTIIPILTFSWISNCVPVIKVSLAL